MTGPTDDLYKLLGKLNIDDDCRGVEDLPTLTYVIDGHHYDLTGAEYVMAMDFDGNKIPYEQIAPKTSRNPEFEIMFVERDAKKSEDYSCAGAFMPLDIPEPQGPDAWIL